MTHNAPVKLLVEYLAWRYVSSGKQASNKSGRTFLKPGLYTLRHLNGNAAVIEDKSGRQWNVPTSFLEAASTQTKD